MRTTVSTENAAPPGGPYSQAVVADKLVFLAGSTPHLPSGQPVTGSFAEQAQQAFENLQALAVAAGTTLDQAVKVNVFLRDMADFAEMNELFARYFGIEAPPARTTIPAELPGFSIEIDAILYKNEAATS
jgi:reactive intermediate/imine deaminase